MGLGMGTDSTSTTVIDKGFGQIPTGSAGSAGKGEWGLIAPLLHPRDPVSPVVGQPFPYTNQQLIHLTAGALAAPSSQNWFQYSWA
jgi:hypothetical protein